MADQSMYRAWRVSGPGDVTKTLTLDTLPRPTVESLGQNDVLVRAVAVGLNPVDYNIPAIGQPSRLLVSYPKILGNEFGGYVVGTGSEVAHVKTGDKVFGLLHPFKPGSLAEFVVAPGEAVATVPDSVSLYQAGAAPTTAMTAYQSITPYVKAGDKVFINGGSGGAGSFGIQIAKAIGCHVTVTCSTNKVSLCKELGADRIIDYRKEDVTAELRKLGKVFSVVVDNVGNSPPGLYAASDDFLLLDGHFKAVTGSLSLSNAKSMVLPSILGGAKHKYEKFMAKTSVDDMNQIGQWMAEGKVKTVVDSVFSFEEVPKAYEKLQQGSAPGKIVVHIAQE